jgi:hypothetical protein
MQTTTMPFDRRSTTILAAGSAVLLALAGLAFWPQYLSKLPGGPEGYANFHAGIATLWLVLLIAQPLLIRRRKMELHRWIGRISWVLAPLYVVAAVLLAHRRLAHMDEAVFSKAAPFLYLPLSMTLLFAASYAFALLYQRDTRLHARFMMCTGLTAVDPILARVLAIYVIELPDPIYQAITFSLMAAALVLFTLTLPPASSHRRVFASFSAGFTVVLALWFWLPATATWFSIAQWFRGLPLT